jgi:hypothetical protein
MLTRRIAPLVSLAILAAALPCGRAQDFGPLNGTWEGELKSMSLDADAPRSPSWRRIEIQDTQARVFYRTKDDQVREVMPGKFRIERHLTNAVVFAMNSGRDNEGLWVETWVFAITQKDRNTLVANFGRVVNNNNLPLSVAHSKFTQSALGELQRKP